MKTLKTYRLFLVCFLTSCFAFSQNKQLRAYTLEDGLPQSQVYAIAQDEKGYMWLGTQGGGLARFDGKDFEVFNETNGMSSNYIHAIKSANDTLFIGSKRGLTLKIKDQFYNIEGPQVNEILRFKNTNYLLTNKGLFKVRDAYTIEAVVIQKELDDSQLKDMVFDGNYFWIATNNGLWKLNELTAIASHIEHLDFSNYTSLTLYENKLFASTFNSGTLVIKDQNFEDAFLIRDPLRINKTSIQNSNQLWIATDNNGVVVLDTETYEISLRLNNSNGLNTSHIRQILSDKQSNLWFATSGGGLFKYFQNSFKNYNTDTGLNGNRIYAVHHFNEIIVVSNSEQGLIQIDPFGIHNIDIPESFSDVKIKTITSDSQGNIWAGSDGKGILFRGKMFRDSILSDTLKNGKRSIKIEVPITKVFNADNGFPHNWIRSLYCEKDVFWAVTYSSGIVKFRYNPKLENIKIIKTFTNLDGIDDMVIRHLSKDEDGKLWYVTQKGHLGFIKDNKVTHKGLVFDESITINSIVFQNKTMFLGTAGNGIWWSNDSNFNTFKKLKGTKTLSSENIYQLIFDDQGYLWSGSERGVDKIELNNNTEINDVFAFGRNEGFLGIETCLNAVDKDSKGHLWFGALNGLVEYQPIDIANSEKPPNLFFEDIKVAYKSIDSISFSEWTNSNHVLQLGTNQRQISFSFKTIDLDHPNGIEYRYKLNDDTWSPWTPNSTQDFSELNYGAHNFTVQSRNHRWMESEPIQFSFHIESPLHKKGWFQWLVIGSIAIFLLWLILLYVKRLKRKNHQEQERLQLENHLLNLEQKALRLQMNPHFIFNVLNGIKAMAPTKPEKMNDTVNNFAALLRETLENSRQETISLNQEMKTLKHYIEVEQLMAEKPFNYEISLESDIDADEILVPPMLIQPFVENAIRHGIIKGTKEGELDIIFKTTETKLEVSIKDNGIGIYESQKQKKKTDHQSMALKVTKERLESISGPNTLRIKEIKSTEGHVEGTIITFSIPLETDY